MNTPNVATVVKTILETAVITIRNAPNTKIGWERSFDAVELLKGMGPSAVDGLISALYSNDIAIVLLAMIYLGILKDDGVHRASKATGAIYKVVEFDSPEIVHIGSMTALALLGDAHAQGLVAQLMRKVEVYDKHEFHMKTMVSIAEYIR